MAEYISRDAAIAYLANHKRIAKEQNIVLAANEDAIIKFLKERCPAIDVVPVVRCKDCKHCFHDPKILAGLGDGVYVCGIWGKGLPRMKSDDFCSYGEKRDGERREGE